jgi:hypothetical protein
LGEKPPLPKNRKMIGLPGPQKDVRKLLTLLIKLLMRVLIKVNKKLRKS